MKWLQSGWLLAGVLTLFSASSQAIDVTITVNGRVVARPCTVSTPTATVNLGDLYTFNLINPGSASVWHDVTMNLTNCPIGTSRVTATFSGTTDATGYYRNGGTAGNIQLQVQDSLGANMNNGTGKAVQVNATTQAVSIPLRVRALTVNGGATQGTIQAVIDITYTYA